MNNIGRRLSLPARHASSLNAFLIDQVIWQGRLGWSAFDL